MSRANFFTFRLVWSLWHPRGLYVQNSFAKHFGKYSRILKIYIFSNILEDLEGGALGDPSWPPLRGISSKDSMESINSI